MSWRIIFENFVRRYRNTFYVLIHSYQAIYILTTKGPESIPGIYFLKTKGPEIIPDNTLSYNRGS